MLENCRKKALFFYYKIKNSHRPLRLELNWRFKKKKLNRKGAKNAKAIVCLQAIGDRTHGGIDSADYVVGMDALKAQGFDPNPAFWQKQITKHPGT